MKKQTPNHNSVVAKDNELIGQMAKFSLSELRLIAFCLAHYDSRKPDNRSFKARVDKLQEVFPMNTNAAYGVVRQTMLNLGRKPLEIQEGNKRHYWNWFSGFTYDQGEGEFEFRITPEIQPYLLKLEGNFTPYRLGDVYQFKAASTWKLYELLKRWLKMKQWEVELDELRLMLGVAGKYPRWADLDRALLGPATAEINELSDIQVNYEKIKRGRSVVGLAFTIHPVGPAEGDIIEVKSDRDKLYSALLEIGVNSKTSKKYTDAVESADKTAIILNKLPGMIKRSKGGAVQKYVLGAIKGELGQQLLYSDQETKAKAYQQAVKCYNDQGKECKRRTNTKAVCDICSQIRD